MPASGGNEAQADRLEGSDALPPGEPRFRDRRGTLWRLAEHGSQMKLGSRKLNQPLFLRLAGVDEVLGTSDHWRAAGTGRTAPHVVTWPTSRADRVVLTCLKVLSFDGYQWVHS